MKLNSIFSSGALLLQNSVTEFRGEGIPGSVITCSLYSGRKLIRKSSAVCFSDGRFSLPLKGEPASFDRYSIEFSCGEEQIVLDDILFGELWLAAGQSNMEMRNNIMENCSGFLDEAEKFGIRYYRFTSPWDAFQNPPFEKAYDTEGKWGSSEDKACFACASAAASAAALVVAERFAAEGKEIPVGFIDTSIGGTPIETWLPLEITDGELKDLLIQTGHYTAADKRNLEYKDLFGANSVFYNAVVAPLGGMKARGMLWYQGEGNVSANPVSGIFYKKAIEILHREYKGLFSEREDERFPLICSLLFPWIYGDNGDVRMGYINQAMTDAAMDNPNEIAVAPIYDLPAKWSYFYDYHPIHPTNKYGVGERLGNLMLSNSYGEDGLKTAAYFKKSVRKKGALELHFETFGKNLICSGHNLRGFYICGKNGTYIPADAEIVSRSAVRVSSEFISSPSAACYQLGDLENDGNLFCDSLPVAPFATERKKPLSVAIKPWLFSDVDSQFRFGGGSDLNVFNYPIRFPSSDSSLCFDPAYHAVRIVNTAGGKTFGMYFKAEKTMPLDLYHYSSLNFTVYSRPEIKVSVKLTLRNGDTVSERIYCASAESKPGTGIVECTVPFRISPDTVTEKMELILDASELSYPTAAIGNLALIPKKS